MSGLLSRAFRSPSGSSLTHMPHLSACGASISELEAETSYLDDSVHSSVNYEISPFRSHDQDSHSQDYDLLFTVEGAEQQAELLPDFEDPMTTSASSSFRNIARANDEEASAAIAHSRSHHPLSAAKPPLPDASGGAVGIPLRQPHSFLCSAPLSRSCPRPIVRKPSSRQHCFQNDADDLDMFVPPHELASSFVDSAAVAESLSRKGSAALRLRTGVLRRTGFLDGHTETLRPQPGSSSKLEIKA